MPNIIISILAGAVVLLVVLKSAKWMNNYRQAISAGFPTFLSSVSIVEVWWMIFQPILIPLAERLPKVLTSPWLPVSQFFKIWKAGYAPFQDCGSDSFMLASPAGNILWTCDAQVVSQVLNKHSKCHLPVENTQLLNLWGETLGSVEGEKWKAHRKVVSSGFNPAMNNKVWTETLKQTHLLTRHWIDELGSVVLLIRDWTSRLALHILAAGFFDKNLDWADYTAEAKELPKGHSLRFQEALFIFLKRLGIIFVVPKTLLRFLPFAATREAHSAFTEMDRYMTKLRDQATANIDEVDGKKYKTFLEAIVVSGTPGLKSSSGHLMPKETVLANMFFTLMAGHEPTGNAMSFIFLLLAIFPDIQQEVQKELDSQLGERPWENWSVEDDYPALYKGWTGAVQKEALRVFSVAQFIWRKTVEPTAVTDAQGRSHTIPADTLIMLDFSAAFQNPAVWGRSKVPDSEAARLSNSPALRFDPTRWLEGSKLPGSLQDTGVPSWYPYGQGPRACIGRVFAQIEITAAIAAILKTFSLDLVVPAAILAMCNGDDNIARQRTRDKVIKMMYDDIEMNVNIHLNKEVPMRLIRRGE